MSGDPRPNECTLWTRVAPAPDGGDVAVEWQVATGPDFETVVARGTATAPQTDDHCVKVPVAGLAPDSVYFYRFWARDAYSPTGRTRTAPAPGVSPDRLRIAFASCQLYLNGYWAAYADMAREDLDFVLHLGDYIYEHGGPDPKYGKNRVRRDPIENPATLEEFRAKYRLYRSDPQLQACHQNHPFVAIWDDHEVVDDSHAATDPGMLEAAHTAWFEYMPVVPPVGDPFRIHRVLPWGDLVDVLLIDSRRWRSPGDDTPFAFVSRHDRKLAPDRTLLGAAQKEWLKEGFLASTAHWRVLGNPVMMASLRVLDLDEPLLRLLCPDLPRNAGLYLNGDQWDAYPLERSELLEFLAANGIEDNIVLTGDIHSFWAAQVSPDVDDASRADVATEFVVSAISAPGLEEQLFGVVNRNLEHVVKRINPHFRYVNLYDKGYAILELTPEDATVEFRAVDILDPEAKPTTLTVLRVAHGSTDIERIG